MINYSQPDFYKFSADSISLANYVKDKLSVFPPRNILDIGAGCGVIGIEIITGGNFDSSLTSLEYQQGFIKHLRQNLSHNLIKEKYEIVQSSIGEFITDVKYDCIISNPPYFNSLAGRKSPNAQRQISRSFEVDSLEIFLMKTKELRTVDGDVFIVFPNSDKANCEMFFRHGFSEDKITKLISIFHLA